MIREKKGDSPIVSPETAQTGDARLAVQDILAGVSAPPDGKSDKAHCKLPLPPEQMTELLAALETRFTNTPEHYNTFAFRKHREGITFEEVKICLVNDPALARTVYAMHKRGGEPDVFGRAGRSFLFFESCKETCPASRDCVYDEKSADWLRENCLAEQFNGSVEEQCMEMGADVISDEFWRKMQREGVFTTDGSEWVDSSDIINTSKARYMYCKADDLCNGLDSAENHSPLRGWRAVAKGSEF